MTARVGVRDITRNFNILNDYDYVEVEDKKTHKLKGLFVSADLLEEVKEYIETKLKKKKKQKLDDMMQFVGMVNGDFGNLSVQDIKEMKKEKYSE